jgi:hypothetical protein
VLEHRAGVVIPSFRFIGKAVAEVTDRLDEFRAAIALMRNRAVFEIPEILARILEADTRSVPAGMASVPQRATVPI